MKGEVLLKGYDASVSDISGERLAILYYDQDEDARCEIIDRNGKKVDGFDSFYMSVFVVIDMMNSATMIPVKRQEAESLCHRHHDDDPRRVSK